MKLCKNVLQLITPHIAFMKNYGTHFNGQASFGAFFGRMSFTKKEDVKELNLQYLDATMNSCNE